MDGLRDEYVTPGQFLFGMIFGTLVSTMMAAATRAPSTASPQLEVEEESPSLYTSGRYEMMPLERLPSSNVALLGHTPDELAFGLNTVDSVTQPGERLKISLVSSELPTDIELETFILEAAWAGLEVSYPTTEIIDGLPTTTFILTKGPLAPPGTTSAWALALIPIIPTILIVGLVAFSITQIGTITKALLPILIVTISGIILLGALLTRRHVVEAVSPVVKRKYLTQTLPKTELEQDVQDLWKKACKWEGIEPEAKFVVFSEDNPYMPEYDRAMGKLLRFKQFEYGEWQPKTRRRNNPEYNRTLAKSKLLREWSPEPVLRVTLDMLPETKEKGWKDFYKGNRVQACIDSYNNRIKTRNVSEEEQKRLHETLKTDWKDLVEYQNLQSWGFASGLLTEEEAQQLYQFYGGESPGPEKWDKLELAEKIAVTKMADELLGAKLKKTGYLGQTLNSEFITVDEPGKTTFKKGDVVSLESFMKENERVKKLGEAQASGTYKIEPKRSGNGGNLLEYLSDSPEFLAQTIDMTGMRGQLDDTFLAAISRARR